ncbi:hypothetical protein JYU34_002484 [Plutella xylostella]|uniref:Uncharacterized protein n=1 Tax=Plutella xylostella TaxID=51655 RepID=A0ABQ7R2B2_PLUXY|nr:hypothetical protein JYU34_002484 [Plutella xylostella]
MPRRPRAAAPVAAAPSAAHRRAPPHCRRAALHSPLIFYPLNQINPRANERGTRRGAPPPRTNLPESYDTPPVLTSIYNITLARYPVREGSSVLLILYRSKERKY